jgi:hypothetical protein
MPATYEANFDPKVKAHERNTQMTTTHEQLLDLKTKASKALDIYVRTQMTAAPMFGYKKHVSKLGVLKENYDALARDYAAMFNEVLESNHGVRPNDIVEAREGLSYENSHPFTALIERKVRKMSATSVGNRIVFFLDDVALGEDEKVSYAPNANLQK